jgi:multicomponent Na+:H+ antiporter subunit C
MELLLAGAVATLYAAGFYLILRRSLVRIVLGLSMLGHGANLLIVTSGGVTRGRTPIVPPAGTTVTAMVDPLPQALILTAIVIGFAVLGFTLVLFRRVWQLTGSEDPGPIQVEEA